ncbi:hypothetical protein YC2023_062039 [Brassica napus]|uniref:Glycoside hydrolase family 19 catalytic domain-containing protein n=1 Tax=Brassica oleracea TaxID=3712 RepID=A0A3P6EN88_BRAOL|nr:unnamed protein product [Brassica oleracea]
MKEVAAFLGHLNRFIKCGYGVATGGPLAWGLCYNKEMSPDQFYCDDYYKLTYPCTPGVSYYHVSPPTHAKLQFCQTGEALKVDLLSHPEYHEI